MSKEKDEKRRSSNDKKEASSNQEAKDLNTTNLAEFVQTFPNGKTGRENYGNLEKSDEFTPL